jgi:hypothetical protein
MGVKTDMHRMQQRSVSLLQEKLLTAAARNWCSRPRRQTQQGQAGLNLARNQVGRHKAPAASGSSEATTTLASGCSVGRKPILPLLTPPLSRDARVVPPSGLMARRSMAGRAVTVKTLTPVTSIAAGKSQIVTPGASGPRGRPLFLAHRAGCSPQGKGAPPLAQCAGYPEREPALALEQP